jgi:hypothetical protein
LFVDSEEVVRIEGDYQKTKSCIASFNFTSFMLHQNTVFGTEKTRLTTFSAAREKPTSICVTWSHVAEHAGNVSDERPIRCAPSLCVTIG